MDKMKWYLLKLWIGLVVVCELLVWIFYKIYYSFWELPKDDIEKGYQGILTVFLMGGILYLSIGVLTIFLNLIPKFRKYSILRFLSFYGLPFILLFIGMNPSQDKMEKIYIILPITTIFFSCLTVIYTLFTKYLKKNKNTG